MTSTMKKATTSRESKKKKKFVKIEESQLKYAFGMFDTNKDGKLNSAEFRQMLKALGVEMNDSRIRTIMAEVSHNDTSANWISEENFLIWFSRFKTPKDDDVEADLRAAFLVFDRDRNGFITRDELKDAMRVMGETLTDRDIDELLQTTDHDRDGKINYEEFIKTLL